MSEGPTELHFGSARLQPAQRRLLIGGEPAKLGARAFDVLLALAERRDRIVTKQELFALVWPDVIVEENNLQVQISTLRKLLGPEVIATIPGRGYRFTADVDAAAPPAVKAMPPLESASQDSLLGRVDELRAIDALLARHRLVSIVGAAGIGKTRIAQAAASMQRECFAGRVHWVELAALSDPTLVVGAIARSLGIEIGERPALATVCALLRTQSVLLVLDNCEHLLEAVAAAVRAILADTPLVQFLLTSQEALHVADETVYRLAGLSFTDGVDSAAVELFAVRAQAADPRFQRSPESDGMMLDICRRLDGMPLAIELAAARVRLLGLEGLHARLDERFRVLTGGTRAVPRRHETLRAALQWSHALLSPQEQTVFRRLGVFVGGFTLELAQSVAHDADIDEWGVLDLLGHLVDKSLVAVEGLDRPRYRLLETMRAFALEQLAAAGETERILERHALALLAHVERSDEELWVVRPLELARQAAELDNLRAALGWAQAKHGELACKLFANSRRIWLGNNFLLEAIERGKGLLPLPEALAPEVAARFHLTIAHCGYLGGRADCFESACQSAAMLRTLGDERRLVDALMVIALTGTRRGCFEEASAAIGEAEALVRPSSPLRQVAALALANAVHAFYRGDHQRAVESAIRQGELYRRDGSELGVAFATANAGFYECGLGRYDEAIEKLELAIAMEERLGYASMAIMYLACAHALRGDRAQTLAHGRNGAPAWQRGQRLSWPLFFVSLVLEPGTAMRLVGYAEAELQSDGLILAPIMTKARDKVVANARAALGPEAAQRERTLGAALSEEAALALAFDEAP